MVQVTDIETYAIPKCLYFGDMFEILFHLTHEIILSNSFFRDE
jgi:hypothetical protein